MKRINILITDEQHRRLKECSEKIEKTISEQIRAAIDEQNQELKTNLSNFFNHDFKNGLLRLFDENGNNVYWESSDGYSLKRKFNANNEEISKEASDGFWSKKEYDKDGNEISYKNSDDCLKTP